MGDSAEKSPEGIEYARVTVNQLKAGSVVKLETKDGFHINFRVEPRVSGHRQAKGMIFKAGVIEASDIKAFPVGSRILLNASSPMKVGEPWRIMVEYNEEILGRYLLPLASIVATDIDEDTLSQEIEDEILPKLEEVTDLIEISDADANIPEQIRLAAGVIQLGNMENASIRDRIERALLKIVESEEDVIFELSMEELRIMFNSISEYVAVENGDKRFYRIRQLYKIIQSNDGYSLELEIIYDGKNVFFVKLNGPVQIGGQWIT